MTPKKRSNSTSQSRKTKKSNTSENPHQLDPVFGQYRALPINTEILNTITPDTIPTDAETYLAMVRKQAESGSSIMFIERDISYEEGVHETKAGEKSEVINEEYSNHLEEVLRQYTQEKEKLPEVGVLGIPDSFEFPNNFTEWRKYFMSHKPETSLVSNLDHQLTIKLIIYCTKWLNNNTPVQISQWIYALLVKVSELLENTDMSILRDLALKARKIRAKEEIEISEVTKLTTDFIIVIISRFYGQKDLDIC